MELKPQKKFVAQIVAEMIFSNLIFLSVHSNLLVSLSKEDIVLETLKLERETRCADNFGTITDFNDDFEMKL